MFHVGQKIARFREYPSWAKETRVPRMGEPITVSHVGKNWEGVDYIEVAEYPNVAGHLGYEASYFRPVVEKKTDISIFTKIVDDASKSRVHELS